jgi:hypothetical protein
MRQTIAIVLSAALAAAVPAIQPASAQSAAKQQQVKLQKGTWWGSVGDRIEVVVKDQLSTRTMTGTVTKIDADKGIVTIDAEIDGKVVSRPLFASNVVSIKTVGGAPAGSAPAGAAAGGAAKTGGAPAAPAAPGAAKPTGKVDAQGYALDENGYRVSPKKGVFVLPWKGGVGQTARHDEIEAVAKEADKWGPGQIIILDIDSPGGLVTEIFKISKTLADVRQRHRVVAWVREAISAAAVTSMHCDEIYFRTMGADGAAMMIAGRDSVYGERLDKFRQEIGDVIEKNGRPRMVFEAMVLASAVLTYTKDPVTGKVTWHDKITGLPGEVVLSDDKDNLTFNASNALDSGFSKGTADTGEELAPLLGLKEWYEVSDYGRKISGELNKNYEECEKDIKFQMERLNIQRAGGAQEQISVEIQIIEKILAWHKRCPPCVEGKVNPDALIKQLKDLKKQLSQSKKKG